MDSLEAIHAYVEAFLAALGFAPDRSFEIDLLIEELFTNFVKYSRGGRESIEVGLAAEGPVITITVCDFNVESFDVTATAPVDTEAPLSERRRGGLGLHLVRRIADDFRYEYRERSSIVTVTKRLER
jgi:serine/threonine-protein kinase RsbW